MAGNRKRMAKVVAFSFYNEETLMAEAAWVDMRTGAVRMHRWYTSHNANTNCRSREEVYRKSCRIAALVGQRNKEKKGGS